MEVSIAAPECSREDADSMARQSNVEELLLFPSFSRDSFIVSPTLIRWLRSVAARFDIVHVHGLFNPLSSLAIRAARRAERAVVVCPHGTLSRYTFAHRRTSLKQAYFSLIDRRNVERAAALHFTSESEMLEARWHGIDFHGRSHVVPPPFLPDSVRSSASGPTIGHPVVLFLSRIHPVKNVDGLLRAWKIVRASQPGPQLVIAGPGNPALVQSFKALAANLGVGASVSFCGFTGSEEKQILFQRSIVFVLPSHHENFGLVVLEAIAAGVPVVISPEVQLAPFVEHHKLGIVAPSDPSSFAAAMISAINDATLRERVAATGREIVTRYYAPRRIGDSLTRMYLSALAHSH